MSSRGCALVAVTMLAATLGACRAPPSHPVLPTPSGAPAPTAPAPLAPLYRIDGTQSHIRIFVTRTGPMAALGHDHIIEEPNVRGWVRYAGSNNTAAFELELPVLDLVVDDPAERRAAGGDFAEALSDEARSGTRTNMLSPALLDAQAHPVITVRSTGISGRTPNLTAAVTIELAGHSSQQELPFRLTTTASRLRAQGEFELEQTALGLKPYSTMLGALRVADVMRIELDVVAIADTSGSR